MPLAEVVKLEISLYTGSEIASQYYSDFLSQNNFKFKSELLNSETVLTVYADLNKTELIADFICRFMVEFYLRETVLSKIYDEYASFTTEDASCILSQLSDEVSASPIKDDIQKLLDTKRIFKPESYIMFNIRSIVRCTYALVDKIAISVIYEKEKERLTSAIRFLKGMNFDKCETADDDF